MIQRSLLTLPAFASVLALSGPIDSGVPHDGDGEILDLAEEEAHREIGYLEMRDGTRLAYVVWRPTEEGSYPTLISFSPYVEDGVDFNRVKPYLDHGYAYVGANVRGTSCSEGVFSWMDPGHGPDGAELVEWAGSQAWSTGAVGMIGISYPGHTAIMTAAERPSHLKAIAPAGLTASTYREVFMPGGMLNLDKLAGWTLDDQPGSGRRSAENRIEWGDTECEAIRAEHKPNRTYYEALEHPLFDAWWQARELETRIARVDVPTLMVHGWQDWCTASSGPSWLFRELPAAEKKIIFQSGGHGAGGRDVSRAEVIRWMDRWLKGERNGIDEEPPVSVFWEVRDRGREATPNWTTTYADWPVPDLQEVTLYLTADGELSREEPPARPDHGERSYLYPTGTELIGNNEQFEVPPSRRGSLTYRTEPMPEDRTILGLPRLTFHVSSEQSDTDFMVTLKDVDPDGNTLFVQRGYLRASLRAVDPERSTPDQIVQAFDTREELVPGRIHEVTMSLYAVGHVVRRGHRLELSILAPSATPQPRWGPVPLDLPSVNRVYHSPEYPSRLTLPIVPGETAPAPPPECGVLQFQPCRPGE
ncbi:MAG: CocE/NonD family hydrolase [Longimicrobiales bacterium]|nr:CocE/NonD family hydrolase [Longimicrobiales bacterium]